MNFRTGIIVLKIGAVLAPGVLLHSCGSKNHTTSEARSSVGKPNTKIGDGIGHTETKPPKRPRSMPEQSASDFIRKKLKSIIIPVIAFEDTSVEEAIDFLRVRSIELDPDAPKPEPKGISFVVRKPRGSDDSASLEADAVGLGDAPEAGAIRLTMHGRDISLWDALHRVAREARLNVEITDFGIELRPP